MSRLVTRIATSVTLLASVCLALPAFAANPFQDALKQFNAKNYRAATPLFEAALKAGESNPTSLYYCALSNQLSGNRARAKQLFEYVSSNFPGSQVAAMASTALKQWQGTASSSSSSTSASISDTPSSTGRGSGGVAISPAASELQVPFTAGPGGHMLVNAEINGKPYAMYFDTGAEGISFTQNDLKKLRIEVPENARESLVHGVGGSTRSWDFNIDKLKVGPIVKEDLAAHVVEKSSMDYPLLGQSFFGDYEYTIDNEHHVINFKKQR